MLWQRKTTAKRGITVEIAYEGHLIRRVPALHAATETSSVEGETNFRLPHRRILNSGKVKYMLMLVISLHWVNLCLIVKVDNN